MGNSSKWKKAESILKEKIEVDSEICELEIKLFKIEDEYLELTHGNNLFKNLEIYIHASPEKKKQKIEESDRTFANDFPRQVN